MRGNFTLQAQEHEKIETILSSILQFCDASGVSLISWSGQTLVEVSDGEGGELDQEALASLTASTVAATFSLAELIGEGEFERIFHRGRQRSLLLSPIGERAILLVVLPTLSRQRSALDRLNRAILVLSDLLTVPKTKGNGSAETVSE